MLAFRHDRAQPQTPKASKKTYDHQGLHSLEYRNILVSAMPVQARSLSSTCGVLPKPSTCAAAKDRLPKASLSFTRPLIQVALNSRNMQDAIEDGKAFVLEANPCASRAAGLQGLQHACEPGTREERKRNSLHKRRPPPLRRLRPSLLQEPGSRRFPPPLLRCRAD